MDDERRAPLLSVAFWQGPGLLLALLALTLLAVALIYLAAIGSTLIAGLAMACLGVLLLLVRDGIGGFFAAAQPGGHDSVFGRFAGAAMLAGAIVGGGMLIVIGLVRALEAL